MICIKADIPKELNDIDDELNKTWMEVENIFEQNLPDQNHDP